MTRTMIALVSAVALVLTSSATVSAQGKRGSSPKPQQVSSKGTTKVSSPKPTQSGPKTSGAGAKTGSQTAKGPKTTTAKATGKTKTTSPATKTAKVDARTTTKTAKAEARVARADAKVAKADAKVARADAKVAKADAKTARSEKVNSTTTDAPTTETPSTTTPPTGDTETPPVVLTGVQEKLQKNTKLAEKLEGRLPRGTDLMEAAEGFRNLGQFVAAVNVSGNLGMDFEKLKIAMVDEGKSLGQAIQFVKTDVENPTLVAQRAETEAQTLIRQTETTTTTATTTTTRKPKAKTTAKRNGSGS